MKKQLILLLVFVSGIAMAQTKKPVVAVRTAAPTAGRPVQRASVPPVATPAVRPPQTTLTSPAPEPAAAPAPTPAPVDRQASYESKGNARPVAYERPDDRYDYGSVIKLNFMGLIVGGVNLDFEKRIARKTAVILTGGFYPYGLLKGSYRAGVDLRQYLGESYVPKGLFISAGGLYHFVPYDNTSAGLANLRALVGYQFVTGHFTFEVAGGPAYVILVTDIKNVQDNDTRFKLGLLPAFKATLGYAF